MVMRISGCLYALEQFACALSLLTASGLACGLRHLHPGRLTLLAALASLACTLCAVLALAWPRWPLMALALLLPLPAWPGAPRAMRRRLPVAALLLSLAMAGCVRLLQGAALPASLALLAACCLIPALCGSRPCSPQPRCATVELTHMGRTITLTALVDSGNLLRDPLTGLPVIVLSRRSARRLTPLPAPGQLLPGMRLISVRTAAGPALMAIFRPRCVRVLAGSAWHEVRAMAGLSPDGYDGVQALLPACLAEDGRFSAS
ncbi:MAG: sigma-E processing peptidase SpoIIGA [Aristaeellaceae bacterium]